MLYLFNRNACTDHCTDGAIRKQVNSGMFDLDLQRICLVQVTAIVERGSMDELCSQATIQASMEGGLGCFCCLQLAKAIGLGFC